MPASSPCMAVWIFRPSWPYLPGLARLETGKLITPDIQSLTLRIARAFSEALATIVGVRERGLGGQT
jgi:hypothetical protein